MKKVKIFIFLFFLFSSYLIAKNFQPFDSPFFDYSLIKNSKEKIPQENGTLQTTAWFFLKIFQIFISSQDGPNCRYYPTCSQFAVLSIKRYGPFWGTFMAADRLLRCNPFGPSGFDPPEYHYHFHRLKKDNNN